MRGGVERVDDDDAAPGEGGRRGVAEPFGELRELAGGLDVRVVVGHERRQFAQRPAQIAAALGELGDASRAGCSAPIAIGTSAAARS